MMPAQRPACSVCDATEDTGDLYKCPNPRCRNYVCARHGLLFEVHDDFASTLDYYCSRQCWNQVRQKSLPISKELAIFAIVLLIFIPIWLYMVSLFV